MDLHDLVELKEALLGENIPAGAVGIIVHVFHRPDLAYEIEFTGDDGRTISSAVLTPDRIRRVPNDQR